MNTSWTENCRINCGVNPDTFNGDKSLNFVLFFKITDILTTYFCSTFDNEVNSETCNNDNDVEFLYSLY